MWAWGCKLGCYVVVNGIFSCSFLLYASFFLIALYQIRKFSPKQTFSMISQTSIIIFPSPVTNKKNNDLVSNIPVVQNQILTLMFLRFFFRVISFLNAKKKIEKNFNHTTSNKLFIYPLWTKLGFDQAKEHWEWDLRYCCFTTTFWNKIMLIVIF